MPVPIHSILPSPEGRSPRFPNRDGRLSPHPRDGVVYRLEPSCPGERGSVDGCGSVRRDRRRRGPQRSRRCCVPRQDGGEGRGARVASQDRRRCRHVLPVPGAPRRQGHDPLLRDEPHAAVDRPRPASRGLRVPGRAHGGSYAPQPGSGGIRDDEGKSGPVPRDPVPLLEDGCGRLRGLVGLARAQRGIPRSAPDGDAVVSRIAVARRPRRPGALRASAPMGS